MQDKYIIWISLLIMAFSLIPEVRNFENDPDPGGILLIEIKGLDVGFIAFFILYFLFG